MRKLVTLLAVFILSCAFAFGQNRQILGKVRSDKGEVVPFATIAVKGTKTTAVADAEGNYQIAAKTGDILVITAAGQKFVEETVGSSNTLVTTMTAARGELEEVVVTGAFGIKKSQRTTAFSSQVIKSEDLQIVRQTNVNSALAGKVAGVQTRSQSAAKLNQEAFLRIRGGLGLGDRAPIYVVDGTITGSFDINPDDIEDITVWVARLPVALSSLPQKRKWAVVTRLELR
jgi:ribosomal protein S11